MKLVFIYGAPATGKLTVAKALAKTTGFRLFHNHLSVDLIASIFDFGSEAYTKYCRRLRLEVFAVAAKEGVEGLIFTFCYADPEDREFVERAIQIVEGRGGEVCFVHLYCDPLVLEERVVAKERETFQKIATVELLRKKLERWDFFSSVPFRESLQIDNSNLEAHEVAQRIKEHFQLGVANQSETE
jgi:predicted kinase